MTTATEPVQMGPFWVVVTLERTAGEVIDLHASVCVPDDRELRASEIAVAVVGAGSAEFLEPTASPGPGALPSVCARGRTAIAQYRFANPGDEPPRAVVVTLAGASQRFGASDFTPIEHE